MFGHTQVFLYIYMYYCLIHTLITIHSNLPGKCLAPHRCSCIYTCIIVCNTHLDVFLDNHPLKPPREMFGHTQVFLYIYMYYCLIHTLMFSLITIHSNLPGKCLATHRCSCIYTCIIVCNTHLDVFLDNHPLKPPREMFGYTQVFLYIYMYYCSIHTLMFSLITIHSNLPGKCLAIHRCSCIYTCIIVQYTP